LKQSIQKQVELIEKSLSWISNSLDGEKKKKAYRQIVDSRRKLKKKKFALESNPAAAIYGESQVGKSYLISSLLSEKGKPFGIISESGQFYKFIEEINPIGGGNESTSLVSRFSVNYKPIDSRFPVKAMLLTPADILLVLCDSYYNDLKADHNMILSVDQINSEVNKIKQVFLERETQQNFLQEDDILDIQDYFREHFSNKTSNLLNSTFFIDFSLLVSKSRPSEWKDLFCLLWNKNSKLTALFDELITEYDKLNFTNTIYLPLEAVLRKFGTLLDVERLKEIHTFSNKIETELKLETPVLFISNGSEKQLSLKKSHLCALASELVFHQNESLTNSKPFLKETDLLDFPGARARMTLPESEIKNENISELLLRGKVAYLFNKYSDAEKISVFLLCAKHDQPAARSMPEMLQNWINKFIGDTPEKRERFINSSVISPLFIIETFFNVNLDFNPVNDKENNLTSLIYRWKQRFEMTLAVQILNSETYSWFNNWTKSSPNFQNIFLLRDFNYSENIFNGYHSSNEETGEISTPNFPDFRKKLRQSFIDYPFVKQHFDDPANSWDEAASLNKDGTELIIEKLSVAGNNINKARIEKITADLIEISNDIHLEISKYYHSNDKDEELQKAKSIAGDIQHKLATAFSADGIKDYGKMIKEFMLNEGAVLELYRKKIDDIEHRDVVNLDVYSTYRIHIPVLDGDTEESYFERMCIHFEKVSDEEREKFKLELEANKIDLEELISGNSNRIKNNAQQLGEALVDYWLAYVTLNDKHTIQQILAKEGSSALQDIIDMYQKLFKKVGLANLIAEKIRHHVDGQSKTGIPYAIIADISCELLNKCINSVGYEYFDASEFNDLKEANEQNKLGLVFNQNNNPTEKSVSELFEKVENWTELIKSKPEEMKSLPSYRNYIVWYHRLKIGFVSVCDIPNYNVQANENLGILIKESETIKY
jgi:hypothetical protein